MYFKNLVLAAALLVPHSLSPKVVAAEPTRNLSPAVCLSEAGSKFSLPEGIHLSADLWIKLDIETKRLQELEIRLGAENKSLKQSIKDRSGKATMFSLGLLLGASLGALAAR